MAAPHRQAFRCAPNMNGLGMVMCQPFRLSAMMSENSALNRRQERRGGGGGRGWGLGGGGGGGGWGVGVGVRRGGGGGCGWGGVQITAWSWDGDDRRLPDERMTETHGLRRRPPER